MSTAATDAPQITIREIVEDVVGDIQRRRSARFDQDEEPYQRKNPIASDIDPDSCKRRQVLAIVKWNEAADVVTEAMAETIRQKTVTYDLERQLDGAKLLKCSEFGQAIIENMPKAGSVE